MSALTRLSVGTPPAKIDDRRRLACLLMPGLHRAVGGTAADLSLQFMGYQTDLAQMGARQLAARRRWRTFDCQPRPAVQYLSSSIARRRTQ